MSDQAILWRQIVWCVVQILGRTWSIQVIQDVGELLAYRAQVRMVSYLYRFILQRLYIVEKPESYSTAEPQFIKCRFTGQQVTDVIEVTEVVHVRRCLRKGCILAPMALVE